MASKKTIGLALGSGSSRGWAHIGVIEALEQEGVPVDCISGCSVGAYVGAIYAGGGLQRLKEFVLRMDGKKIFSYFDVVFPRSGLFDGTRKLKELFSLHTDAQTFSDLKIPLIMVATDQARGERVVIRSGDLIEALRATMSVPGLFAPARIKDRWVLDGGLLDPVPVGLARAMGADVVIAVDLNSGIVSRRRQASHADPSEAKPMEKHTFHNELLRKLAIHYEKAESNFRIRMDDLFRKESSTPDIVETVMTAINIMQERITRVNLAVDPPDVLIQPQLGQLKMLDFDQVEFCIEEGYLGARKKIDVIKRLLEDPV